MSAGSSTVIHNKKQILVSPPAILKILQILLLMLSLVLFLVSGECLSNPVHMTLFVMPVVVCTLSTIVTVVNAGVMIHRNLNPLLNSVWVKGDVLFNIVALMVIAFGVASTLADSKCTQDGLTIAAVSLCVVVLTMYAATGALIWMIYIKNKERFREERQQGQQQGQQEQRL